MLKPLDARVVVEKPKREEQTASGIILPDTVNEQSQTAQGVVVSVGPGSRNMMDGKVMPMSINEGDTIVYTKFTATEIIHNEKEYFVVAEKDIIAIVDN